MKKVYICSRYRADDRHTVEDNVKRALYACRYAATEGYTPYAPHLYLPQCLDDNDSTERELGLAIGQQFLKTCDEVWQWGGTVSEGMAAELALAKALGIPIKAFPGGPCADVRPERRGRWERFRCKGDRSDTFRCSNCGYLLWYVSKFCPNCGTKMEGKDGVQNDS